MKKLLIIALLLIVSLLAAACSEPEPMPEFEQTELLELANSHVNAMLNADFNTVAQAFNPEMAAALDEQGLQKAWLSTVASLGNHLGHYSISSELVDNYFVVTIIEQYELNGLQITIAYTNDSQIAGLNLNYASIEQALLDNETLSEIALSIGSEFPLAGILTLPKNITAPPVVLLVHGSGSSNKDAAIYQNTPFKDIAHGLAEQGIATLRYDKRYYTYPEQSLELGTDVTLEDEVLADLQAALDLLANEKRIDNLNIYVLGHSLGGGLTPYIAYTNPQIKGIISMAGSLRPLYELSYDQNKALEQAALNGLYDQETAAAILEQMKQVEQDIEILRSEILTAISDEQILLGIHAGYQKSAKDYAGYNFIEQISLPILVLQGTDDFQVIAEVDYLLWENALTGRDNVQMHLYQGLNHLMMPSNGRQDLSEYEVKGVVSADVINDIAAFINYNSAEE